MRRVSMVEVFALPPAQIVQGVRRQPDPYKMDPQPMDQVPYPFGSDEAKHAVRKELTEKGFVVRFVNFSDDKTIKAIVNEKPKPKRKKRSARSRR